MFIIDETNPKTVHPSSNEHLQFLDYLKKLKKQLKLKTTCWDQSDEFHLYVLQNDLFTIRIEYQNDEITKLGHDVWSIDVYTISQDPSFMDYDCLSNAEDAQSMLNECIKQFYIDTIDRITL